MTTLLGLTHNNHILPLQALLLLHHSGINIEKVCYLNSGDAHCPEEIKRYYAEENLQLDVDGKSGIGQVVNQEDYDNMEDHLFQWYRKNRPDTGDCYVFVSGGHKLLALALLRCAYLMGATQVFHMFYNGDRGSEPKTTDEINSAISVGKLTLAIVSAEPGWPVIRRLNSPDHLLRQSILSVTNAISRRSIEDINQYPFECLNLLPQPAITWLDQPVIAEDEHWIKSLPKTELHCHLGGFGTHGSLLDEIRDAAVGTLPEKKNIPYPSFWPKPDQAIDLMDYMHLGDNTGSHLLKDPGCLVKQCELLYKHLLSQNIRYAEIRCSPYNYATDAIPAEQVLTLIMTTFNRMMSSTNLEQDGYCHINLIIIATRRMDDDRQRIDQHLSLAKEFISNEPKDGLCQVVAVDLAGYEIPETRAALYRDTFERIHRKGIAVTIHAGENDEAEGIWQAVFDLNTRRIGHGLNLYQSADLLKSVVNRQIGIEMCPYANYQIKGFKPMSKSNDTYPLLKYLEAGAKVTVNTDNIGISAATLTDNFMLLSDLCPGITRMQVLQLIRNGLDQSFIDHQQRQKLIRNFNVQIFHLINIG